MPARIPSGMIEEADAAVVFAQQVRKVHRRRSNKTSKQRKDDLKTAVERLRTAMKPLRSEIGRFPYGPDTEPAELNRQKIRAASAAIQRERRKLHKMKR